MMRAIGAVLVVSVSISGCGTSKLDLSRLEEAERAMCFDKSDSSHTILLEGDSFLTAYEFVASQQGNWKTTWSVIGKQPICDGTRVMKFQYDYDSTLARISVARRKDSAQLCFNYVQYKKIEEAAYNKFLSICDIASRESVSINP